MAFIFEKRTYISIKSNMRGSSISESASYIKELYGKSLIGFSGKISLLEEKVR